MKARDIMTTDVITVPTHASISDVARLLTQHRISAVPVVDDERRVLGIVTQNDLFLQEKGVPFSTERLPALFEQWVDPQHLEQIYRLAERHTAADVMTQEVACVDADDDIGHVATLMVTHDHKRVPVVSDGKLAGIITRADMVQLLVKARDRA